MNAAAEAERSDHELLLAHVDGDPDAFATLFRRHRDRLWAVALRTMGNPEDAADGLQDGMISAYRRAGSFREQPAVSSVMLACDVLHADRTIYGSGLDLSDLSADVPVGPSCRLCTRRDCASRQEEALSPGGNRAEIRAPLLPTEFGLGDPS